MQAVKVIFVLSLALAVALDQRKKLEGNILEKAKRMLDIELAKLATGDGPKYNVVNVNSAFRRVTDVSLYEFQALLVNGSALKNCTVTVVLGIPWLSESTNTYVKLCKDVY
ncbi:hypothetical protein KR084_007293 [Drosophila pseudotakahashii]|nr:hypothetical protein KR084_007293 [Drosophila pseudotakahashii]